MVFDFTQIWVRHSNLRKKHSFPSNLGDELRFEWRTQIWVKPSGIPQIWVNPQIWAITQNWGNHAQITQNWVLHLFLRVVIYLVAPTAGPCLTVEQLLYWSDSIWTGRVAQNDAKTKLRFGNIVPKQSTLLGFVQHTTINELINDFDLLSPVSVIPGAIHLGSWWNLVGRYLGLRCRRSSFMWDVAHWMNN